MENWNKKLCQAAREGGVEDLELCLANGANIDYKSHGATALMFACMYGQLEVCRKLIAAGCDITITVNDGCTALHLAAARGYLKVTKYLVEEGGFNPSVKTDEGKTPYDVAGEQKERQYKEVMEYLIKSVMSKHDQDVSNKSSGNIHKRPIVEEPSSSKKLKVLSTPDFERDIYQSFRDKTYDYCKLLLENHVNEDVYEVLSTVLMSAFETKDKTIQELVFARIVQESPKIVKQFCMQNADIVEDGNVWMAVECTCDKALLIQYESEPCRKANLIFVIEKKVTSDYRFPNQFLGFDTLFLDSRALNNNEASKIEEEMMKCLEKVPIKVSGTLAKKLFNQHSNLTMVCSSVFKSKGFKSGSAKLQQINCVQLVCKKKGIIPIGECHFPLLVDDIPTDVLEGTFKFLSAVNVGDKISCNEKHTGTLGGFVKYYGMDTFLTCSHVIFGKNDLLDIQSKDLHSESRHIIIHNEKEPVECVLIRHSLKCATSEEPMETDNPSVLQDILVLQDNPEETSIDAALILIQTPKNDKSSVLRNVLTRRITDAPAGTSSFNTQIVEQKIQLQGVDPIYINKNVLDPENVAGPVFAFPGYSEKQKKNRNYDQTERNTSMRNSSRKNEGQHNFVQSI